MKYCSLGDGCMPSFGLKRLGLKTESYPFDWLNCKSEIIKLCIADGFKDFLDRSLYVPHVNIWEDKDNVCQHSVYTPFLMENSSPEKQVFFRHRDPLGIQEDYEYYVRCVDRFKNILSSEEEKVFIKTYSRQGLDESMLEDATSLADFLGTYTTNYKVIAVKQSLTGTQSINVHHHKNLVYIEITTIGDTDGGEFYNEHDRKIYQNLIQHFITNTNEIR